VTRALRRSATLVALLVVAGALAYASHAAFAGRGQQQGPWERAIALAHRADRTKAVVPALQTRDRAIAMFRDLTRSGPAPARSRAAMLAGLLELRNGAAEPDRSRTHLALAVSALRTAVRLDPANDDAAYDLELLLSRSAQGGHPIDEAKPEKKKSRGRPGASPVGTGY
jgi:hypothetical protein